MPTPVIRIVPGWTNSGPDHWQTHWERENPGYRRVIQRDWDHPDPSEWLATLDAAVDAIEQRVLFVAHSLGCIAVAKWVAIASVANRSKAASALLVAPSDVDRPGIAEALQPWRPVPFMRLPFPSVLVASRSDEYLSFARAQTLAAAWGSDLVDVGDAGHLNSASGYGPWPEGHRRLVELIERVSAREH